MCKVGLKTLIAVFLFGTVARVSAETHYVLMGKVKEVDAQAHEIVIQAESGAETLPFTDSTKLSGLRPDSLVKDLLPGDSIIVLYSEMGGEKQTQEIKSTELSHKVETLEGSVIRVYRFARLMFVKTSEGKEKVFHLAKNAILIVNGRLVSLADLAADQGERVKLYYITHLGSKTVQAMVGQQ